MTLEDRITNYLENGGLWNPEEVEHDKVRTLLLDCRTELATAQAETAAMLEKVAVLLDEGDCKPTCDETMHDDLCPYVNPGNVVRALIPTDHAAALAEHDMELLKHLLQGIAQEINTNGAYVLAHPEMECVRHALAEHDKHISEILFETFLDDLETGCADESAHPKIKAALVERERKARLGEAEWWNATGGDHKSHVKRLDELRASEKESKE